jgi:hypothetical protein
MEDTAIPTEAPAVPQGPQLTPLQPPEGWVAGKYASFPVSPEPMYGPDELGVYKKGIEDMDETVARADSAARVWEVMQAWEARNFARGYHFMEGGRRGWSLFGAVNGSSASGAEILQSHNAGKLFPVNVYGARMDKSSSVLASEVPSLTFVPDTDSDPMDQAAADEKKKYLKVWLNDAGIKGVVRKIADYFYTDDRVVLLTWSVADEQARGTETPKKPQQVYGAPESDGVTPETQMQPMAPQSDVPAVREVTIAYGKLEAKVPIYADSMDEIPWVRIAKEQNVNTLKERYPWIEEKIKAGATTGRDDIDRLARINVRLAVQTSSSSGESWQQDATESITFYRPSQFRSIKDKATRDLYYQTFPKGLMVINAGGEFAFAQNRALTAHIEVLHAKEGSGQNRRAIGTNYLPIQKILNANISLIDRYFRSCVPRRFHAEPWINTEAINGQFNDPAKSTPVTELPAGKGIQDLTGIENVPSPHNGMFEFIQWMIQGAPEVMDGMEPSMFGAATGEADQGVYQTAKLKRDAARGVYSLPWSAICLGLAKAAEQAAESAALNRIEDISSNVPGQGKITVEIGKMTGNAYCYPESLEIPQTIAEQEAQMADLLENGQNVAIYQAIANDPRNLTVFSNFPSLSELNIPGLDAVEQQEGEFELLMQSGPIPNPQLAPLQEQLMQAEGDPEAQTPEGQQALQQLQQAIQSMPPEVSSVPVAQDGSENHLIHAAITLGKITSPEGRKLKNGDEQQQAIYQNLMLHWKEHEEMKAKLTPVPPIEAKFSVSAAIDKAPPSVQQQAWAALGVQAPPSDWEDQNMLQPHEVTTEKEGVDANGVPVKQKISVVGKGLQ